VKGIRIHAYGPPDRLVYEELPNPKAGSNEVVVCVEATGVNPADYKFRNGALAAVNPKKLPFTPGMDIAGRIESIGAEVTTLQVGDRVLAMLYVMGNGGYAEKVAVPAEWCAPLPSSLDPRMAAALPTPATTAVEWILDDLRVHQANKILVTGAAGAVGRIACYVAKEQGAHVTAAVRTTQVSDVRYADEVLVLDAHEQEPGGRYDCIADTIGGATAEALLPLLNEGGVLSTIATTPVTNKRDDVTVRFFGNRPDAKRLARLAAAVAEHRLDVPAPRIMRLSEAPVAHELMERGGAGKIVLVPDHLF